MTRAALLVAGALATVAGLSGCGGGSAPAGASLGVGPGAGPDQPVTVGHGIGAAPQAFRLPVTQQSPTAFVPGEPATEKLPTGQQLTMNVTGPLVANAIAGKPAQFAKDIRETFTLTATLAGGAPVTLTSADFSLHHDRKDTALTGPTVVVATGASRTWTVSAIQTPGAGALHWSAGGTELGRWDYVAEND